MGLRGRSPRGVRVSMIAAISHPLVDTGDLVVRILLAVVLGGVVGFEREVSDQPAGLRTHISVAVGAALFGIISVHGFDRYVGVRADTNYQIDVTRVASQVVVGIGFLGAGAIVKEGANIRGLTTAASLWVMAAIGLAVGIGSYLAAALTTAALVLSLIGLRAPRRWVRRRLGHRRETALIRVRPGADPSGVVAALAGLEGVELNSLAMRHRDDGTVLEVDVRSARDVDVVGLLGSLAERDDVVDVSIA